MQTILNYLKGIFAPRHEQELPNCLTANTPITKQLFQTAPSRQPKYVVKMLQQHLSDPWEYRQFNDSEIRDFMLANPLEEFPNIYEKFLSLKKGAHKADLFRYYYLYVNGGLFLDSDAMLYTDIDSVINRCSFVSVNSSCHPGTIFQGILGACPHHPFIYLALKDAYKISNKKLHKNYHQLCQNLYTIVVNNSALADAKLYTEKRIQGAGYDHILDESSEVIFKHYWQDKHIPADLFHRHTAGCTAETLS